MQSDSHQLTWGDDLEMSESLQYHHIYRVPQIDCKWFYSLAAAPVFSHAFCKVWSQFPLRCQLISTRAHPFVIHANWNVSVQKKSLPLPAMWESFTMKVWRSSVSQPHLSSEANNRDTPKRYLLTRGFLNVCRRWGISGRCLGRIDHFSVTL